MHLGVQRLQGVVPGRAEYEQSFCEAFSADDIMGGLTLFAPPAEMLSMLLCNARLVSVGGTCPSDAYYPTPTPSPPAPGSAAAPSACDLPAQLAAAQTASAGRGQASIGF